MKQNLQLGMEVNPVSYAAPEMTVSSITVEHGFAESSFDFTGSGIQDFENSDSEWGWE